MRETSIPVASVIVIVKDERFVADTLQHLEIQCRELKAECLVIDASNHRLDEIKNSHTWVRWIDFETPIGSKSTISLQRNFGLESAESDIVVFLDAGCIPSPDWLNSLCQPLLSSEFNAVGGPLEFLSMGKVIGRRNFQVRGDEVEYPSCGNLAFNMKVVGRSDIFNTELSVAEDDDFAEKLRKAGEKIVCIPTALITVDSGNQLRHFKRAWRYGKGIPDLFKANPNLILKRIVKNPDILLYPFLLIIYPCIFIYNPIKSIIFYTPFILSLLLIVKNGGGRIAFLEHLQHFFYGAGLLVGLVQLPLKRFCYPPVLQYPNDRYGYLDFLDRALNKNHQQSTGFPEYSSSNTLNLFLTPFLTPILKLLGVRIINIHWIVGKWQLHWGKNATVRVFLWLWFRFWLYSLKFFRIKIVYTVHDVISHSKVFNNDLAALNFLIEKADEVVCLNSFSESQILKSQKDKSCWLVEEGAIQYKSDTTREEERKRLAVPPENLLIILVGNLQEYKGIDIILDSCRSIPKDISIRLAGKCEIDYQQRLNASIVANDLERLDFAIRYGFLSNQEFASYLIAADYFVYPCRDINNSGSLNAALSAGLPVIVPDLPELEWVSKESKIVFNNESDMSSVKNLSSIYPLLPRKEDLEYRRLAEGAFKWSQSRTWEKVGSEYRQIYLSTLDA
jgi:glycosyltransferase involved in cell wall biosynthesis